MDTSIIEMAGTPVPAEATNIAQAFEATGLNWQIEQKPIYSDYGQLTNFVANYRSDTHDCLGIVHPNDYTVVQNIEAFNFIDNLPNFHFERVGVFQGGKKVFVVGKHDEKFEIDSGDEVDMYFTFIHGHDGKTGIKLIMCPIRMFCMNQLNLMMKNSSFKRTIVHKGDVETKLVAAQEAFQQTMEYTSALKQEIRQMINTKMDIPFGTYVRMVIPDDDKDTKKKSEEKVVTRALIQSIYENTDNLQNYKGTAFGYLSAVSDYISHLEPKRNREHTVNNMFISNMEGNSLLNDAYTIVRAIAA